MTTPFSREQSDLAIWPETIVLVDCNGGLHEVRGRLTIAPEATADIEAIASGGGDQIHCELPSTSNDIQYVRRTVDGIVRQHQVLDQEQRLALFGHMRLAIQSHWETP